MANFVIKKIKYLFVYTDTNQLYDISKERNEYSFLYVFEFMILKYIFVHLK